MGVHARTRGRLAAAITTTALIVSGGLAVPLLTAGTAAAATLPPWNFSTQVSGDEERIDAQDLVIASDGSAVILWNGFGPGSRRLYAAVRPAHSNTFGPARTLATTPTPRGDFKLVAGADGQVTALWVEMPQDSGPDAPASAARLVSATVTAGVWSESKEVLGTDAGVSVTNLRLAAGPQGTVTAAWSARPTGSGTASVAAASRSADGTWTAPAPVATAAAEKESVDGPDVAVDTQGTAVIAYRHTTPDGLAVIETVTRPGLAGAWGAPVPMSVPDAGTNEPNIGSGPDGSLALTWSLQDVREGEEGTQSLRASVRRSAAAGWDAPKAVPIYANETTVPSPEPLIAPDGDVTLVWWDWRDGGDSAPTTIRSSTLTAGAAAWGPMQAVSQGGEAYARYEVSIGPDGTARVVWTDRVFSNGSYHRTLMQAARTSSDDTWTKATGLPDHDGYGTDPVADIAAGPAGQAAIVWHDNQPDRTVSLHSARTFGGTPVAVTGSTVPSTVALAGTTTASRAWTPSWTLDQTAEWTLTLNDRSGQVFKTFSGMGTTVAPKWNGRSDKDTAATAPNGRMTWTLKGQQPYVPTSTVLASGSITVTGGTAVPRDFGGSGRTPDGIGDLFSVTSGGGLRISYGDPATGKPAGTVTGAGWPAGVRPVPMGDMSGDRCNDVLVRMPNGEMRRYTPACGATVTPTTAHKVLGSGWNAFDVLTSPGDVNRDGRPDLVTRNPSTGALYLYATNSTGYLAPAVKLSTAFKGYKKIVGVGDTNGDGNGDLLLQDNSNELWGVYGTGTGTFGARVLRATDWGSSYNALVGTGDITGDGRGDLLARDTSGALWRYNGTGKGTFGPPAKIATGWQGYTLH